MKKPSWFRIADLLILVGTAVIVAGLAAYGAIVGVQGNNALQGLILMFVVAFAFVAIWAKSAYDRKKWLDTFIWYPTYGFMVHAENGWQPPTSEAFDALVKATLDAWTPLIKNSEQALMSDVKWVTFRKNLDETTINPAKRKVNGLTLAGSHTFGVDIDSPSDPIETTAFAHELGHVIMGNATNNWNEADHHRFMKEHKLR